MQPTFKFEEFASVLREFMRVSSTPNESGGHTLDSTFDRLAVTLFRLQFSSNHAYRRFCQARGVEPGQVTHWSEIPALPTAAFKEFEVSCLPTEARTRVFHSSGTTEQKPGRHYHD